MREVVIVAGVRTPIGNFGGALKDLPPHKMGELVVREVVSRAKVDPRLIDEVIVGSVGHTSDAYNVARAIALMAGPFSLRMSVARLWKSSPAGSRKISAIRSIPNGWTIFAKLRPIWRKRLFLRPLLPFRRRPCPVKSHWQFATALPTSRN